MTRSIIWIQAKTRFISKDAQQDMLFGISSENAKRIKDQNAKKQSASSSAIRRITLNKQITISKIQTALTKKLTKESKIPTSNTERRRIKSLFMICSLGFIAGQWTDLNDNGVIAFITNRTFIDSRAFDGFRKSVQEEFDSIYIVDLRSDVRANPKIAGTTHNVFGIQTGVAIAFLSQKLEKTER
ncbi:MAG: hypothetical protein WKF71_19100 [Pyrinomonadaceae bacterium]